MNGQFDASTAKIFKSLQKNTSGFDQDSLETLRAAATLLAAGGPTGDSTEDRFTVRRGFPGTGRGRQRGSYNDRTTTGTCSSHLLTGSSREGLLGKITTWWTIMLGLSSVTSLHINVTD